MTPPIDVTKSFIRIGITITVDYRISKKKDMLTLPLICLSTSLMDITSQGLKHRRTQKSILDR
jgi:hypothetical protein